MSSGESESLASILEENRDSILESMRASLRKNVSFPYQDFLLNTQDGQRRMSIFLDMALESLRTDPDRFFQDQKKVGYYRAIQGFSLGDVSTVPLSLIEASSNVLLGKYKSSDAIPKQLVKELTRAHTIIINSMRLVAQAYIITREERIASEANNIKMLYIFTQKIMSIFNIEDISYFVSRKLKKVFGTDFVSIKFSNNGILNNSSMDLPDCVSGLASLMEQAWEKKTNLFVAEDGGVHWDVDLHTIKRAVIAPIKGHANSHGVVALASAEKGFDFTAKELSLLEQFLLITTIVIENSMLFDKLQINTEKMSLLTKQMLRIREEERKRIAEDIHDSLTQIMTGISYRLQYCFEIFNKHPEQVKDELADLIPTVQKAITQSRDLISNLHPDIIDNMGLVPALERLANNIVEQRHIDIELNLSLDIAIDSDMTISIYRVTQEALANVIKHSNASKVKIVLDCRDGQVCLRVSDNGIGFDLASSHDRLPFDSKFGLFYIQQRVESMAGRFTIKSSPQQGCTILATFPQKLNAGE